MPRPQTAGARAALLKYHRNRVLTADDPSAVRRHLADAFADFGGSGAECGSPHQTQHASARKAA